MTTNVIYVLKEDGYFFREFAPYLLDGSDEMPIENAVDNIMKAIYSGNTVNDADHYVLVSYEHLMTDIDIVYRSLFNRTSITGRSATDEFPSPTKWSIILSYLWKKFFDSLWKISYAKKSSSHESRRRNDSLPLAIRVDNAFKWRSPIHKTFIEKMRNGEIGSASTRIVETYDPIAFDPTTSTQIWELEKQLTSITSEQLNSEEFVLADYQKLLEEENQRLQHSLVSANRIRGNLHEENQRLWEYYQGLMQFAWGLGFIKMELNKYTSIVTATVQRSSENELCFEVMRQVVQFTNNASTCIMEKTTLRFGPEQPMTLRNDSILGENELGVDEFDYANMEDNWQDDEDDSMSEVSDDGNELLAIDDSPQVMNYENEHLAGKPEGIMTKPIPKVVKKDQRTLDELKQQKIAEIRRYEELPQDRRGRKRTGTKEPQKEKNKLLAKDPNPMLKGRRKL